MVILLDKYKKPAGFLTEKRTRKLISQKRAFLYRVFPAVLIGTDLDVRNMKKLYTYRIKIDPGAVHTGITILCNETDEIMYSMQIEHRGAQVKKNLDTRRSCRRNRRSRETRYRKPKWDNRKGQTSQGTFGRETGWLPPSVRSVADNVIHWVEKLKRYIRITDCSFEAVRFDSQLMDNPEISGMEYQHGTLWGYELREYLMEHFCHTCQYCGGESHDPVLEWEHMVPKSRGGSDRVKNANLACSSCNRDKGNRTLTEYLDVLKKRTPVRKGDRELNKQRIEHISGILEKGSVCGSSRYSAWVNSTRRYLEKELFAIFGKVECSSGGRTKHNRTMLGLPKDHHYDAVCIGAIPENGYTDRTNGYVLYAKAMGRGTRLLGQVNSCGIITVKYKGRTKKQFGFMTGDIVRVNKPKGKFSGEHTGRVMVRSSGYFDIRTGAGLLVNASHKYMKLLQHNDGYQYCCKRPDAFLSAIE